MKLGIKLALLSFIISLIGVSQIDIDAIKQKRNKIPFIQNDGQWHQNVKYRTPLGTGSVYLEKNVFTYLQLDNEDINTAHDHSGLGEDHSHSDLIDGHAWRATFIGANKNPVLNGGDKRTEYHNYFIGNNKDNWASHVPLFDFVNYASLYTGIDMKVYSLGGSFKYDFIIAPNGNPTDIQIAYTGLDKMEIRNGNLVSFTTVGEFIERAPYAYQIVDSKQIEVACQFVLTDNTVSFVFPEGYDKTKSLVIDPILVGATLSGGTVANYGHCATYDNDENIYTGARSFDVGYPTTDGAFQIDFAGETDISISKLSPDASALIYATYLGGGGHDLPHSLVVNNDNELYVFGTTRSNDYPVSDDAFDIVGPDGGISTDIIITHLSEDGTSVLGSTYVGDESNDGLNTVTSNYGDQYRGEIIVDEDGNCYIASSTASASFPTTSGAYQETYGGGLLDAVLFSMTPDLSTMNWSTYIGGSTGESGLGLRLDIDGNIYMCGTTQGEFMTMSGYQTTYQGGNSDAFVLKLIDNASSIEYSSYWGTDSLVDAAFFIDVDVNGNVYLFGQSNGGLSEVTDGVYSNEGSHQFICSLSSDLEDLLFGTVIGNGGVGLYGFIPIAFMVDMCGYIYFSGHQVPSILPLTDDALYTDGGLYVGVLEPDAVGLEFATMYSGSHVDGGTSNFDPKNTTLYQAVCSCEEFTTTDDAFSAEHGGICDIGVFKIDFELSDLHVFASGSPSPESIGYEPFTVDFENTGSGTSYEWDFDDGSALSTEFEPTHIFTESGIYNVRLVAFNPDGCIVSDTTYIEITVLSTASINENTNQLSLVYVFKDNQFILSEQMDNFSFSLFAINGQIIMGSNLKNTTIIPIKNRLETGVYIWQIESEGMLIRNKILIE